jgi:hypothetical protein
VEAIEMTTIDAARTLQRTRTARVGLRDAEDDRAAVEWEMTMACPDGDSHPVTVVGDDSGLSPRALELAADIAQRRHLALHVVQVWSAQRRGVVTAAWLATRQAELDSSIADVQARHPGLPIATRIELMAGWVAFAREQSSLVVTGPRLAGAVRTRPARKDSCPVAIVPD